ncbi:MAG: DNA polymerase III subunit delta [Myxococcota bacterium]
MPPTPSAPAADTKTKQVSPLRAGPELDAHLASGRLRPVYVVTSGEVERKNNEDRPGADPQALLDTARRIEAAALQGGDPTLDLVKIDYIDGDFQGTGVHALITHEARSMSLFGGRRVVSVVHADDLDFDGKAKGKGAKSKAKVPAGEMDPLEWLLQSLDPQAPAPYVLIFVAEHFDRRKRAYKALVDAGVLVEVPPMTEATLQEYLETTGAPYGITVEKRAAGVIWNRLGGADAARLRQTADRLLLDAGSKGCVTVKSVEENVPLDRDAAVWAITDAIVEEDVTRALTVLDLLLEHVAPSHRDGEVFRILGFLNSHYTKLLRVASGLARGKSDQGIAADLGMEAWKVGRLTRQVRAMKPGRLERAVAAIDAADLMVKSSGMGDRKASTTRWMEQLLLSLARGANLRIERERGVFDTL